MAYAVEYDHGGRQTYGMGIPAFTFQVADEHYFENFLRADDFTAAQAFIRGDLGISGDLIAAVRFKQAHSRRSLKQWIYGAAAHLARRHPENLWQSRWKMHAAQPHNESPETYHRFPDSRFVYTCAYFKDPNSTLEQAEQAKLEYACRKLDLQRDDTFLDIGCGWGGLIMRAAGKYGVRATGSTQSHSQFEFASSALADRGFEDRARIRETDYRGLEGRYRKIAAIGVFENIGRRELAPFFQKIVTLLEEDGLFLSSGITRPHPLPNDPRLFYLQQKVFPGGEPPHLSEIIAAAENAGFEILDTESLRSHYVLTCRAWIAHLQEISEASRRLVGDETYRTWLLYLAASAISFEDGRSNIHQLLMAKNGIYPQYRLTRDYMYR